MKLENLPKVSENGAKRVGRGPGSGKGKTSGRGTKGQNARSRLSVTHSHFEGGQRPIIKRLPYRRGKGNPTVSKRPLIVNVKSLNHMKAKDTVNVDSLIKAGIVRKDDAQVYGIKILGDGEIKIALTIDLPISKSAAKKIESAGGKVSTASKS